MCPRLLEKVIRAEKGFGLCSLCPIPFSMLFSRCYQHDSNGDDKQPSNSIHICQNRATSTILALWQLAATRGSDHFNIYTLLPLRGCTAPRLISALQSLTPLRGWLQSSILVHRPHPMASPHTLWETVCPAAAYPRLFVNAREIVQATASKIDSVD